MIVPAPRLPSGRGYEWPTKPSCPLFAWPRKIGSLISPCTCTCRRSSDAAIAVRRARCVLADVARADEPRERLHVRAAPHEHGPALASKHDAAARRSRPRSTYTRSVADHDRARRPRRAECGAERGMSVASMRHEVRDVVPHLVHPPAVSTGARAARRRASDSSVGAPSRASRRSRLRRRTAATRPSHVDTSALGARCERAARSARSRASVPAGIVAVAAPAAAPGSSKPARCRRRDEARDRARRARAPSARARAARPARSSPTGRVSANGSKSARTRVVVEIERAHARLAQRRRGATRSAVLRSAARSIVVTSVRPSRVTTTRSRHAVEHDRVPLGVHDVVRRARARARRRSSRCRCASRVRTRAQRGPRADVVPAEVAGQHEHARAALEHADVHRDAASPPRRTPRCRPAVRGECGATSGVSARSSSRKSPTRHDEDSRVPQIALRAPSLGASRDPASRRSAPRGARRRSSGVARLDVAEARVGPHGHDADRHERVLALRERRPRARARAERRPSSPIAQSACTQIITASRAAAPRDLVRRPRERGGGAGRPRLGDDVLARQLRRERARSPSTSDAFVRTSVRSGGTSGARRASVSASSGSSLTSGSSCFGRSGVLSGQKREPTPPARTTAQRRHALRRPCSSGATPASSAARAYSFFGLNGFVRNSLAPSSIACWCCCSWPAAVSTMLGTCFSRSSRSSREHVEPAQVRHHEVEQHERRCRPRARSTLERLRPS